MKMTNTTTTEKEQKIKKYLEQEQDEQLTTELKLIINNDYKYYKIINETLKTQYQKRYKKDNFNLILFYQITFNLINYILDDKMFYQYYSYNKKNVDVKTRYHLAKELTDDFITEYDL